MTITIENILLIGSVMLFVSVVAGKTSYRFGIPTLVLFLFIGMLSGSEGFGGINFNDPKTARFIGVISLNFILFSGGLDTRWKEIKPVLWQGITLSTVGVFITALTLGVFVWLITDFTIYESLLLGSIVSSTDAAAVFSILRSKKMELKNNLRPMLELESGSNDPMAYVLTILFLGLVIHPGQDFITLLPIFLRQMILGALMGFTFGKISKMIINGIQLGMDGLYFVLVIALMLFTFSFTDTIGGNGFLAVYLCGVYLGNQDLIHKNSLLKMFDGLAWLMQIVLFLTLGLLVFPSQLWIVAGLGLLISAFLIFVARPLSVFIGLLPFRVKSRDKLFVSWVGLRGAVPIVFATYPLLAGIEKANLIFNIVFFISLTSLLLQGTTLEKVSRWLRVSMPEKVKKRSHVEQFLDEYAKTRMVEIEIPADNLAVGQKIIDLQFPPNSIIAMINRDKKFFTPHGSTVIEAHDILVVLVDNQLGINNVYEALNIVRPEE